MVGPFRILVVDGSRLMAWLVGAVAPEAVEVEHASSLAEAREVLTRHPPQAAVFDLTPTRLPWHELADLCRLASPPIPFRCFSASWARDDEPGDSPGCRWVVDKPRTIDELRAQVDALVRESRQATQEPGHPAQPCDHVCPGLGP